MDLALFLRVVRRNWIIVCAGAFLAVLVAAAVTFRVSPGGSPPVEFRQSDEYVSRATILVTQEGFPWGSLFPQTATEDPEAAAAVGGPSLANAQRLASLPALYAEFVESDQVRDIMLETLPKDGWEVQADPVLDQTSASGATLPILAVAGIADSPELAQQVATTANKAIKTYVERLQDGNAIPADDRVILQTIERPKDAEILTARSWTLPIVAFLGIMILTVGAAFAVDNLRRNLAASKKDAAEVEPGTAMVAEAPERVASAPAERHRVPHRSAAKAS